ncbi:hypothetical protein [Clostridium hydrogenum]|nr:hypothetical protein [Clostridium hydrogenum]
MGLVMVVGVTIIAMFFAVFCGVIKGIKKESENIYLGEKAYKNKK